MQLDKGNWRDIDCNGKVIKFCDNEKIEFWGNKKYMKK